MASLQSHDQKVLPGSASKTHQMSLWDSGVPQKKFQKDGSRAGGWLCLHMCYLREMENLGVTVRRGDRSAKQGWGERKKHRKVEGSKEERWEGKGEGYGEGIGEGRRGRGREEVGIGKRDERWEVGRWGEKRRVEVGGEGRSGEG